MPLSEYSAFNLQTTGAEMMSPEEVARLRAQAAAEPDFDYDQGVVKACDELTALQAEVAGLRKLKEACKRMANVWRDTLSYSESHENCKEVWGLIYPEDAKPKFIPPTKPELRLWLSDTGNTQWSIAQPASYFFLGHTCHWREINEAGEPIKS